MLALPEARLRRVLAERTRGRARSASWWNEPESGLAPGLAERTRERVCARFGETNPRSASWTVQAPAA